MNSGSRGLLLRNVRPMDGRLDGEDQTDVLIEQDRIVAIGRLSAPPAGFEVLDLEGCLLLPSLIDLHVDLRDPGYEYKETLEQLADAAVAGGYTRLVTSPDTQPVNDTPALTRELKARGERHGGIGILPLGALTVGHRGEQLTEMRDLVEAGVSGFSDGGHPIERADVMRGALEYAAQFDRPVFLRCQDPSLAGRGLMHEGYVSTVLGLKGIPAAAEDVMVYRAIALARISGARIHLTRLSSATAVDLIRTAKREGVRVTCDVSPQHLWFTDTRVRGYGTFARVSPPLRDTSDREALIRGLNDGTIDAVASGHSAQSLLEKEVEFEAAQPGVAALETTLAAIWTLVIRGELDRSRVLEVLCHGPAGVVGLPSPRIAAGAPADLVILSPEARWTVEVARFRGPCRSSLFEGIELRGRVMATLHRGRLVFRCG